MKTYLTHDDVTKVADSAVEHVTDKLIETLELGDDADRDGIGDTIAEEAHDAIVDAVMTALANMPGTTYIANKGGDDE